MSIVENGNKVTVHYVGSFTDGTKFDSARDRGEPMTFDVGSTQIIKGFSDAVVGMSVGETKTVQVSPPDAYGNVDPNAVGAVPLDRFPGEFTPVVGGTVIGQNDLGQKMMATITAFDDANISLDFNHPLAGKTLQFDIELVGIT